MTAYPDLKPFVVHGHDHDFRDMVVGHLRSLAMQEPMVLDGVASAGRTVIEKFEEESLKCNLAVVLLTPDDHGTTSSGAIYNTARPNVWIELGYFMAMFGRKTGRTILVYRKGLDIPTDLAGVVYIDATSTFSDPDVAKRLETELNAIVTGGTIASGPDPSRGLVKIEGVVHLSPVS